MNGRKARQLRKTANYLSEKDTSIKITVGHQVMWEKDCPKGIYRRLKKEYN